MPMKINSCGIDMRNFDQTEGGDCDEMTCQSKICAVFISHHSDIHACKKSLQNNVKEVSV